jgi:DNA-binding GntR family transcriptional regulator
VAKADLEASEYEPYMVTVARYLREAIFEGKLKPGEPVRQEAVAQELEVSRIPVREALRQLESEGLVTIRPNSGARVAVLDFDECVEIYKIRERLEPLAFGERVGKLDEEELDQVASLAKELEGLVGDQPAWLQGDRQFHLACYGGDAESRLTSMIIGFWNTSQHYRRVLLTTFTEYDFELAHDEHRLMIDALRNGDTRIGEELLRNALERSRRRLTRHHELFDR